MMDASLPQWLQAGGVLAFAAAVWWELREQGKIMRALADAVAALLERDRMRGSGPVRAPTLPGEVER
jgi:hypothetical protein